MLLLQIGNPDLQVDINQIGARVLVQWLAAPAAWLSVSVLQRDYWRQLVRVEELTGNSHAGWGKIDNLWKSLDALVVSSLPSFPLPTVLPPRGAGHPLLSLMAPA